MTAIPHLSSNTILVRSNENISNLTESKEACSCLQNLTEASFFIPCHEIQNFVTNNDVDGLIRRVTSAMHDLQGCVYANTIFQLYEIRDQHYASQTLVKCIQYIEERIVEVIQDEKDDRRLSLLRELEKYRENPSSILLFEKTDYLCKTLIQRIGQQLSGAYYCNRTSTAFNCTVTGAVGFFASLAGVLFSGSNTTLYSTSAVGAASSTFIGLAPVLYLSGKACLKKM